MAKGDSGLYQGEVRSRMNCCGRKLTPYRRFYEDHLWEEGYRCKKCGRIRIPINRPKLPDFINTLSEQVLLNLSDNLKDEGINIFDFINQFQV